MQMRFVSKMRVKMLSWISSLIFQGKPSVISKQGNNAGGILALFFAPFLFLWNMIRVFLFGDKRSSQPKREDTPDTTETPDESQSTRRRDRPQT